MTHTYAIYIYIHMLYSYICIYRCNNIRYIRIHMLYLYERPPKPPTFWNSYTRTLILDTIMKLSGTIGVTQKTMTLDTHVRLILLQTLNPQERWGTHKKRWPFQPRLFADVIGLVRCSYVYIYTHACKYHSSISPETSQGFFVTGASKLRPTTLLTPPVRHGRHRDLQASEGDEGGWCRGSVPKGQQVEEGYFSHQWYIYIYYIHYFFTTYKYIWYIFIYIIYVLYIWEFFHLVLKEGFLSPKINNIWFDQQKTCWGSWNMFCRGPFSKLTARAK